MKYLFYYKRTGLLRYLSNHETMRMIERLLRRTGMKFKMTEGFHQRMKFSFGQALPTGIIDRAGVFLLISEEKIENNLVKTMNSVAPRGIEIVKIENVEEKFELGKSIDGYIFKLIFLNKPSMENEWKIEQKNKIWTAELFVPFNNHSPKPGEFGQYLTLREKIIFKS